LRQCEIPFHGLELKHPGAFWPTDRVEAKTATEMKEDKTIPAKVKSHLDVFFCHQISFFGSGQQFSLPHLLYTNICKTEKKF
jgi:hypothetical protein